jgi:toxin ParE1/3/4
MAGAKASFSVRAKEDLLDIGQYTLRTWGEAQAVRYLAALEKCAALLAQNPALGRSCDWIRAGLLRFESGSHVLFYRKKRGGIFVVRVLHQRMLPEGRLRNEGSTET